MKRLFKLFLSATIVAFAGFGFCADYKPESSNVKIQGRTMMIGDVLWLTNSACAAEFSTNSKKVEVTLVGDSSANGQSLSGANNVARIGIFVDGKMRAQVFMTEREQKISVPLKGKKGAEKQVQIVKLSECANSTAGIKLISLDDGATMNPLPQKSRRIEIIGDSITCGYGVDDLDPSHHFSTQTENAAKTYGYLAAKKLDADYSLFSYSGWGIVSGYSDGSAPNSTSLVPAVYSKLGYSWGGKFMDKLPQDFEWDFSQFQPDVIVVNLGTNDSSWTKKIPERVEEYTKAYVEFLKDIRSKNPNAHIICALGIMGQDLFPAIEKAVKSYKEQSGDEKVSALKFDVQDMNSDGLGADWHPSPTTHIKAASVLSNAIKRAVSW